MNAIGDVVACALGVALAKRLGVVKTIVLALAIEGILLITIRDNLLLNIIMLLFPSDTIRVWQSGN